MRYDVVVIGGGPAGMMAAGRAAECGACVLLLEKNPSLGQKLLITGGGRCNLTNAEPDRIKFFAKFKESKKFLFSPFSVFGVEETLRFFHDRHMPTKTEAHHRVFPASDQAQAVWDVLARYMDEGKVTVRCGASVTGFETEAGKIHGVRLGNGEIIRARSYVLATGGRSHPETGSTGDGFRWLEEIGHTVREPEPSLVPLKTREQWSHELSGISLDDAGLSVFQNSEKRFAQRGRVLFTHFGLSGPLVLNMSRDIRELLKYGKTTIVLDPMPGTDYGTLDRELLEAFSANRNKRFKNGLGSLLLPALAAAVVRLSGIDSDKPIHAVSRNERIGLGRLMKNLPLTVSGSLGADRAIVTSGGVAPEEADFRHMRSRLYPNLYLVGDILDIDRPSGGYSLQLCWTTGHVAGTSAAEDGKKSD